jgi:hypothetical protein
MNSMWSKRSVVVAIALAGAAGRLAGCATMGSSGKMLYELPYEAPFVIAESNQGPRTTAVTPGVAIDPDSGIAMAG